MIEEKNLDLEKTILVGIIHSNQDAEQSKEYLDELAFLALTAGGDVCQRFVQRIEVPHPKTFIGSGKMDEVAHTSAPPHWMEGWGQTRPHRPRHPRGRPA